MKKILLLPGSAMQIPLIKKIKEKGHYVMSLHPTNNFPTQSYSDEYALVDILNHTKCLEIAKEFKPDIVLSEECDIAIPTIAYLSKELGLSSLSESDAALYTDKSLMREFCQKNSILSPAFCKCTNLL